MSRFHRAMGMARSLAIYHGIPLRQRRMRKLYARFVRPGALVFDIGAHAGNRSRAFVALGCLVIAVAPQPEFSRLLRFLFARSDRVQVLEAAVGARPGRGSLIISERTPTVSTLADDWRRQRAQEQAFSGVRWNERLEIPVTSLDELIARFGMPAFAKIDVEGFEPFVLEGLTQAPAAISFEYLPGALVEVRRSVTRLGALGPYRFNWSQGETYQLFSDDWLTPEKLLSALAAPGAANRPGDVYAVLTGE